MDDLAHEFSLNHRKRKADQDSQQDSNANDAQPNVEGVLRPEHGTRPAKAPRLSWLSSTPGSALWNTPSSPQISSPLVSPSIITSYSHRCHKRARLDKDEPTSPLSPDQQPSSPLKLVSSSPVDKYAGESVLSTEHELNVPSHLSRPKLTISTTEPVLVHDLAPLRMPPMLPHVTKHTLRDLDFNEIMHNTPLRHDILFDSGIHFRRRKKDSAERYWDAITREVISGCTCVSYDAHSWATKSTACICDQVPLPKDKPMAFSPSPSVVTIRTPSRVNGLLTEFREVLLHVIQPLSSLSGPYVNTEVLAEQIHEHAAQATYIQNLFDPDLIEQELKHRLFDPSGLFQVIGTTLKQHCAPMRDQAIEKMIQAAQACSSEQTGTKDNRTETVKVIRDCLEILELMKLDIANHQLQMLRPFLICTSGPYERKMLRSRRSINPSLPITKEWLRNAHSTLNLQEKPLKHASNSAGIQYAALRQKQQLYISIVKAIVDLVFSSSTSKTQTVSTPLPSSAGSSNTFPETLYLDQIRIRSYTSDTADTIALWMLLLLYRQLLASDSSQNKCSKEYADEIAMTLKNEIHAIGPSKLGRCLIPDEDCPTHAPSLATPETRKEADGIRSSLEDVVLQVARRATGAQRGRKPAMTSARDIGTCHDDAPSKPMVTIAQNWATANMKPESSLSTLLRSRLKEMVFEKVLEQVYPARLDAAWDKLMNTTVRKSTDEGNWTRNGIGLEQLDVEVQSLVEKISCLVIVHFNAYLPLYEKEEFIQYVFC